MTKIKIRELQKRIMQIKQELADITKHAHPMAELISTTNVLRTNEYLSKKDQVQSQLLSLYDQYANGLEILVSNISKIKANLAQLRMRKVNRTTRKRKPRKKITKRKKSKRKTRKTKKHYRKNARRKRRRSR